MSRRNKSKTSKKTSPPAKKSGGAAKLFNRIGMVVVIGFVAFCLTVIFTTPPSPQDSGPKLPQRVGTDWEYDERFNAYWDPRPGHEHWHEGRPPAVEDR
jgi:hypothetical protein